MLFTLLPLVSMISICGIVCSPWLYMCGSNGYEYVWMGDLGVGGGPERAASPWGRAQGESTEEEGARTTQATNYCFFAVHN